MTEILKSDGSDVPSPSLSVVPFKPEMDLHFYRKEFYNCILYNKNFSCVEDLEIPEEGPTDDWGGKTWVKRFGVYEGWVYIRHGSTTMDEASKDEINHLFVVSKTNVSRFMISIYDKNEYAFGQNYLKTVELDSTSKTVYLKIKKQTMATNCNSSVDHSHGKCVQNYLVKVYQLHCIFEEPTYLRNLVVN